MEAPLNRYASEGWRVTAATTAEISGFGNKRKELIVLMERRLIMQELNGLSGNSFEGIFFAEQPPPAAAEQLA